MAEAAAQVVSLPKALNKLSEEQRDSVRSWVEEMLKEWGELGENDYDFLQKNYGLEREDSQKLANYIVDKEDIMPCVDLETKILKISKSTYELGRVLGTGKYAEVRKGRNVDTRKPYALKVLYVDGTKREVRLLRDQIRDELRAFKKLKHRNIVRLHAFDCRGILIKQKGGKKERPCYIQVQELCSSGELYEYVQYNGCFSEALARTVFFQFMQGLAHAHERGIAHRDLKPDNVLLDHEYTVKICDFGFSKVFQKEGSKGKPMHTILGTSGYMAPEMLMKLPYNEKADIFSAGVILFILLAGYPPLQTAEIGDWWFERLLEGRYHKFWQAHEQGDRKFSVEAKKLIIGMLEPSPAERYDATKVLNSEWINGAMMDRPVYKMTMGKLKKVMDRKREEKRKATSTRDTEIDKFALFLNQQRSLHGPQFTPSLERLCENVYVQQLKEVKEERDLLQVLQKMGTSPETLKLDDAQAAALALVSATSLEDIQAVLDVKQKAGSKVLDLLQPMSSTAVQDHLNGMEGLDTVKRFFQLSKVKAPKFNPEFDYRPLTSHSVTCGYDVLNFCLRYVTKAKFPGAAMMPVPREARTNLKFKFNKTVDLPALDQEAPTEAEIRRREILGLPIALHPAKTVAQTQKTERITINMEVQCFQDPDHEGCMLVCISPKDTTKVSQDFLNIVDVIFHETIMAPFIVKDKSLEVSA